MNGTSYDSTNHNATNQVGNKMNGTMVNHIQFIHHDSTDGYQLFNLYWLGLFTLVQ